jgi:PAS domain S-box-containing protein
MPLPRLQADFFDRIADPQGVRAIFEHMPGVFFFMKDDQGRHIAANSATYERFGIKSERELVGAMDEKFFPPEVAKAYREDDQKVIRSGKPLINRLEVWYDEQHNLSWFLCTKLPVLDKRGKVIGVMGITRRDEDRMRQHDVRELTAPSNTPARTARRSSPRLNSPALPESQSATFIASSALPSASAPTSCCCAPASNPPPKPWPKPPRPSSRSPSTTASAIKAPSPSSSANVPA